MIVEGPMKSNAARQEFMPKIVIPCAPRISASAESLNRTKKIVGCNMPRS